MGEMCCHGNHMSTVGKYFWWHKMSYLSTSDIFAKIWHGCHGNAFSPLSYRFDTSTRIFHEPQDVSFPKLYGRNFPPPRYRHPNFQGMAHGLHMCRLPATSAPVERIFSQSGLLWPTDLMASQISHLSLLEARTLISTFSFYSASALLATQSAVL